jgi:DNA mismatch endonuclease (patch repair protein)
MTDVFTRRKRSEVMSRIKSRNNRETELLLASLLRKYHISGWRRHLPLPGRPDFTFRRARVIVFVDGCFWHCCPKCGNMPANNAAFWKKKLEGNRRRDARVTRLLIAEGWRVLRIWEHDLKKGKPVIAKLQAILSAGKRPGKQ